MVIRKAILSDLETLINFQWQLAFESEGVNLNRDDLHKGMKAMLDDPSKGIYFVVEENGEVIGCHMITYEWSDWRNGMIWWLQSVFVKEEHRKKGVFKKMYDHLRSMVESDPNILGIRLYVDKSNAHAMKAYESIGMDGSHYTVYEWMKN